MSGEQTKRLFAAAWQHEAAATIQRQLKGWRVSTGKSAPNVGWRSNRELEMRNARLLAENRELKQANVALRDINERYNPTKIEAERTKAAEAQRLLQFELGKVRDELQAAKASAALEASKAQAKLQQTQDTLRQAQEDRAAYQWQQRSLRSTAAQQGNGGGNASKSVAVLVDKAVAALQPNRFRPAAGRHGGADWPTEWRLEPWFKSLEMEKVLARAVRRAKGSNSAPPLAERAGHAQPLTPRPPPRPPGSLPEPSRARASSARRAASSCKRPSPTPAPRTPPAATAL